VEKSLKGECAALETRLQIAREQTYQSRTEKMMRLVREAIARQASWTHENTYLKEHYIRIGRPQVSDASSDNVTVKALLKAFSERRIVRVAMMLCLGFVTLGTHAAEPDTFGAQASLATLDSFAIPELGNLIDAYVADQITYDDNLYRLPNGITNVEALIGPNASRQDHINTASLGTSDQWIYSGQAVGVKAQADDNRYSRNTDLDNLSGNAKGVWDWRAGRSWLGELGADFTRSLAGAANSKFFSRDLVNQSEYFGTALFGVGLIGTSLPAYDTQTIPIAPWPGNSKISIAKRKISALSILRCQTIRSHWSTVTRRVIFRRA
jgi:hypothetical protein